MKKYLLDTNICIHYMKGRFNLVQKVRSVGGRNCYISDITAAELYYGAECSREPEKEKKKVESFLAGFKRVSISEAIAYFAFVKAALRRNGTLVDDFDLLIGATAVCHNMVAVTENVKHIGRIPKIQVENWIDRKDQ
ncbi:MAG: type II toxin-antitoxin system VapC family toxin [Bacteroidaceae bacterium]|nr:type II toxin-antitoxin system VapC family toxin [Bacteroidaceae bacterium]